MTRNYTGYIHWPLLYHVGEKCVQLNMCVINTLIEQFMSDVGTPTRQACGGLWLNYVITVAMATRVRSTKFPQFLKKVKDVNILMVNKITCVD